MAFHINPETGTPALCKASVRPCPYGDASVHYESEEIARQAYEMQNITFPPLDLTAEPPLTEEEEEESGVIDPALEEVGVPDEYKDMSQQEVYEVMVEQWGEQRAAEEHHNWLMANRWRI